MTPIENFWRNLRDLPQALTLSAAAAGLIPALVGYTGPLLIVLQAAKNAGLTQEQTASWVWGIAVVHGVMSILLSLYYRQPILAPWPTAGAALLVDGLVNYTMPQAVGAYIVAGLLLIFLGVTGLFSRMMQLIPQPVVLGMLAGILLRFGLGLFSAIPDSPLMVIAMLVVFFVLRRIKFRAPILGALIVGMLMAGFTGQFSLSGVQIALTRPLFILPEFTFPALLNLAIPLFVLSVTSQFAPGQAVLRSFGYTAPINGILVALGFGSIAIAPMGGHGLSLGALTSAIVAGPDAHPDPDKRYAAAVVNGLCYMLFGLFGTTVVSLFAGFPPALVASLAGLALSGTIASSLASGLAKPEQRDGALVAFLVAASGVTLLKIGAPFWALVAGVAVNAVLNGRKHVTVLEAES